VAVKVLDSRPVVIEGGVRHRMRLDVVKATECGGHEAGWLAL